MVLPWQRLLVRIFELARSRILSDLKLGKQAPGYKAATKALDRLIALLQSHNQTSERSSTGDTERSTS
jgi:hypothetical protein